MKKRNIFLLAGFFFAFILAGSSTSVTAVTDQEHEAIADRYYTNIKNAMRGVGCNTVRECDDYCYKTGEPTPDCYAYDPLVTDPPSIVSYMQSAGCGESDPFFKNFKTCVAYCDKELTRDCFPFIGYREDLAGLNKLYDKFKNEDETGKFIFSTINSIKNNIKLPPVCQRRVDCINYCSGWVNTACIDYGEKTGYISSKYADKARKFLSWVKTGNPTPSGCDTMGQCEYVCGQPENFTECTEFAKKVGWAEEEIPPEKQAIVAAMKKGESPGQCKEEISCRAYCENIDNIEECISFVEKFDLASDDELKEIRQVANVKKAGVAFPGNCKTKESCLKYCDNPANAIACMEFAQKAGFIPKEDAEAVGKILPYLKSGGKLPGGCTTKESCDKYCDDDAHTNECVDFAVKAGFMPKEDAEIVKKTGGKSPGNCRSREACDNYCKDEKHIDECVDFAVKAGFISEGDAADAKKYRITSGPGNCKSKADCEAFCVLPENQETCFKFAKDHGMISEEDLKNIEQYRNQGPPDFSQVNPKWLACMEKEMRSDTFGRFKAGKSGRADVSAIQTAQKKCQDEMGPDIRKEIEVCLGKATCTEFNTCMNALQQGGKQQLDGQQQGRGASDPKVEEKMQACKKEIQKEKADTCLAKPCGEFEACLKSLEQSGDKQGGQQQGDEAPDPKVSAKAQSCQKEKVNACLAKSCSEFQACLNSLGGGSESGKEQGTPDPAVLSKVMSCQPKSKDGGEQQQTPQQGGDKSQIPQGYSSWEAFCRVQIDDSRCSAYKPQIPQYPLLIEQSFLGAIFRYLLK